MRNLEVCVKCKNTVSSLQYCACVSYAILSLCDPHYERTCIFLFKKRISSTKIHFFETNTFYAWSCDTRANFLSMIYWRSFDHTCVCWMMDESDNSAIAPYRCLMLRSQNDRKERSPILWKIEKHFKLKKLIEWKYERTENDASNFHRQVSIFEKSTRNVLGGLRDSNAQKYHMSDLSRCGRFQFCRNFMQLYFLSCMEVIYCTLLW